jgi:hypothetical protein
MLRFYGISQGGGLFTRGIRDEDKARVVAGVCGFVNCPAPVRTGLDTDRFFAQLAYLALTATFAMSWTTQENKLVRMLPAEEVAQRTGRSLTGVYARRSRLPMPDGRRRV